MSKLHLVDTTLFFAPHSGGVKRYLLAKNRHLNLLPGIRHTLVVPGESTGWPTQGVRSVRAPRIPFAGGYRAPWRLSAWRNELCALQPDLIEVGDPYQLAWTAASAADQLGVPAIAFAHSDAARCSEIYSALAEAALDAYVRRLYSRFDLVMAPSETLAAKLRSRGVERVVRQPLGVDGDVFHPAARDPSLRASLGLPANTRLLVFAGRIASEKRIPLLREVVDRLGSPYHLLLVGGECSWRSSASVTELHYQNDSRDIARLLASADVLLHVGNHETFGLIILETMSCGRPVVGIDAGPIPELVDDTVGMLAHGDSPNAIAEAVHALYERDLDALGTAARHRIEQLYTWDRVFARQLQTYAVMAHRAASLELAAPEVP